LTDVGSLPPRLYERTPVRCSQRPVV
jgi:hypothetical protein